MSEDAKQNPTTDESTTPATGQQPPQAGQQPELGQQSDTLTTDETKFDEAEAGQKTDKQTDQGGSGFVGTGTDQSSDYLTKGENEDFQPEDLASDTSTGTADVETGQPTSPDATLDDGSDTSR